MPSKKIDPEARCEVRTQLRKQCKHSYVEMMESMGQTLKECDIHNNMQYVVKHVTNETWYNF